ncbi:MAG: hypothetical protein JF612_11880, partial [Planctomycetia bacterium]|nr:hypothetical protein [Planctomycetia bacterium]
MLDESLKDARSSPGDKYYWRSWNYLQLGDHQRAYDDAISALKSMANSSVFQLAGIASYNLGRVGEAKTDFESSVQMDPNACDSLRYLGVMDSAERNWPPAHAHFSTAAGCYQQAIVKMSADVAQKQADTSGLYANQIAALVADIAEARSLQEASTRSAEASARNQAAATRPPAGR